MKRKWTKRLAALALTVCMVMGLVPATAMAVTADDFGSGAMSISVSGNEITCTATMNMGLAMAQYVSSVQANQTVLPNIDYKCTVTLNVDAGKLPATLSNVSLTSDIFEIESGPTKSNNTYTVDCKLKDGWNTGLATGETVVSRLMETMTFTATATVSDSDISAWKNANFPLTADGKVDVTGISQETFEGWDGDKFTVNLTQGTYTFTSGGGEGGGSGEGGGIGGGTGSGSATKPTVEVTTDNKGDVTVSDNKADKGDKVTLTPKPDEGYRVRSLRVYDKDGKAVPVTKNADGTYTFTMPEGSVTVDTKFILDSTHPDESGVSTLLETVLHNAFMQGDDKGYFNPNDDITRAEVAQIFYNLLRDKNVVITADFDDVSDQDWYAPAVRVMASLGIFQGVGGNNFAPKRDITRAELAVIASRFAKAVEGGKTFNDVPADYWAADGISTAATYGWVNGVGNGNYEPLRNITRTETAAIVNRMLGRVPDLEALKAGHGRQFPDVDTSHWGWDQIGDATTSHGYDFLNDEEIWDRK